MNISEGFGYIFCHLLFHLFASALYAHLRLHTIFGTQISSDNHGRPQLHNITIFLRYTTAVKNKKKIVHLAECVV